MSEVRSCAYCLAAVEQAATTCPACEAAYHRECWEENGGCCARDCRNAVKPVEIELGGQTQDRIVISREQAIVAAKPIMLPGNPCISCGKPAPEGEVHCAQCAIEQALPIDHDRSPAPVLVLVAVLAILLAWLLTTVQFDSESELAPGERGQTTESRK